MKNLKQGQKYFDLMTDCYGTYSGSL